MIQRQYGFTIVELLIVIIVIAILAAIGIGTYQGVQRRAADISVQSALDNGTDTLRLYDTHNHMYPSNIADTEFAPPSNVAMVLYTNANQIPIYQNLTPDQNAQLFLNACNGSMPVTNGGTTYNTSCTLNGGGINLHVAGQNGSNWVKKTPIQQSDFVLTCGSVCSAAQTSIVDSFLSQGGVFPINGSKDSSSLPAPTLTTVGDATRFCLEATTPSFADIIYHTTSENTHVQSGACPNDAELHYP